MSKCKLLIYEELITIYFFLCSECRGLKLFCEELEVILSLDEFLPFTIESYLILSLLAVLGRFLGDEAAVP